MAKIKPIGGKILVKRREAEEKTAGGIVLPDAAREKPKEGTVVALGDGKVLESGERAEFQVKKGDRIIFTSYAGSEVTLEGEDFILMDESDILAIID